MEDVKPDLLPFGGFEGEFEIGRNGPSDTV